MAKRRSRSDPQPLPPLWAPRSSPRRWQDVPLDRLKPDFRPAFLDFDRGIRMGNLEPNQRITRILRQALEDRHQTRFITDRWGRGMYWQWICWIPVENRKAKPISSSYNFGCAKFYVTLCDDPQGFEAGLQIERAPLTAAGRIRTQSDWDFHTLVRSLRNGTPLAAEVARLVRQEGFTARAGPFAEQRTFAAKDYPGPAALARAAKAIPGDAWGGFQLCYVLPRGQLRTMTGDDIIAATLAVFDELVPAMNLVMTVPCLTPLPDRCAAGGQYPPRPPPHGVQ
jgi:hypothetical protein